MRLIDADALRKDVEAFVSFNTVLNCYEAPSGSLDKIMWLITNAPTVQQTNNVKTELKLILKKISDFCPADNMVDLLDDSPKNQMRLTIAEVGDTARAGLLLLDTPTVQREGWIPKLGDLVHPSKEVCQKFTEWKETELLKIVGIKYKLIAGSLGKYSDVVDLTVIELANDYGATDGWKLEDVVPAAPDTE